MLGTADEAQAAVLTVSARDSKAGSGASQPFNPHRLLAAVCKAAPQFKVCGAATSVDFLCIYDSHAFQPQCIYCGCAPSTPFKRPFLSVTAP